MSRSNRKRRLRRRERVREEREERAAAERAASLLDPRSTARAEDDEASRREEAFR